MAALVDPFSSATAELSDDYISFFSNPDIVPKYLEAICDKTGVQLLTGYSAISIKGSWVSINTAHSFLSEFLTSYLNSDFSKNQNGNKDQSNSLKGNDERFIPDGETEDDLNGFHKNATLKHVENKDNAEGLSDWHKWASDVLPLIQRRRSKHTHVFTATKCDAQKAPEPLVLYADIQPVPNPAARKLPTLNEIERVLKKVYEKDTISVTPISKVSALPPDESKAVVTQEHQRSESEYIQNEKDFHIKHDEQPAQLSTCLPHTLKEVMVLEENMAEPAEDLVKCLSDQKNNQTSRRATEYNANKQKLKHQAEDISMGLVTDQNSYVRKRLHPDEVGEHAKGEPLAEKSNNGRECSLMKRDNNQFKTLPTNSSSNRKHKSYAQQADCRAPSPNRKTRRKGRPRKNTDYTSRKKSEGAPSASKEGRVDKTAKQKAKSVLVELNDCPNKDHNPVNSVIQLVSKKRGRPRSKSDAKAEDNFTCDKCSFVTKKHSHLRQHKRRVHITKEFKCDKCGKIFGFGKDLKRHRKTHQKAENCCSVCGKMYKGIRSLEEHKKTHAEGYIKPEFPCEFCSKIFSTKYVLAYHIKSDHLGMKRTYLCPTCGKSFSQKNSYLQHANVHMGIRPYQCDVCGKSFSYEKSLKEHRYMHEEDKQFECPVCKKKFRQSSGVAIHMKIHKERKDYVCSACGKGFSQKQALIRHERIHAGEKPFTCGVCKRNFTDSSILRRHMILIHKKDPKKWREDTISNVSRRTDFFISVLNEHDESANGGELLSRGTPQPTLGEDMAISDVDNESTGGENEDNLKLMPENLDHQQLVESSAAVTPELCKSTEPFAQNPPSVSSDLARVMPVPLSSVSEEPSIILHVSNNSASSLNHEFGRDLIQPLDMSAPAHTQVYDQIADAVSAELPSLSAGAILKFEDNSSRLSSGHSRTVSVPLRSVIDDPISILPITHNPVSSYSHVPLRDLTQPLDMSAPGLSQVSGHNSHHFSTFGFGDHRLQPSDLYPPEMQIVSAGLQMPYSSMLSHGSMAGYYQPTVVMVPETVNTVSYHAGSISISSSSELSSSPKYEQMAPSPAMQQVQYSPSSTPQL